MFSAHSVALLLQLLAVAAQVLLDQTNDTDRYDDESLRVVHGYPVALGAVPYQVREVEKKTSGS